MKAGQTLRFTCGDCATEFELTLEPKAKDDPAHGGDDKQLTACPYCGSLSAVECDDGDESEGNCGGDDSDN